MTKNGQVHRKIQATATKSNSSNIDENNTLDKTRNDHLCIFEKYMPK